MSTTRTLVPPKPKTFSTPYDSARCRSLVRVPLVSVLISRRLNPALLHQSRKVAAAAAGAGACSNRNGGGELVATNPITLSEGNHQLGFSRSPDSEEKTVDLSTLGNLCVDIVLNVPNLPPDDQKRAYMDSLAASKPDKRHWEAGGNCNLAIAAARLGLQCVTLGLVGNEIYGRFLLDVLDDEGIGMVGINEDSDTSLGDSILYETLKCWVLVDPLQKHGFCSVHDFNEDPAFNWITKLSGHAQRAIGQSRILFCNGYTFDEFSPGLIVSALKHAKDVGTAIFFDPGPRGSKLLSGSLDEQAAVRMALQISDILLLTAEEAESLTGAADPIAAGRDLIAQGLNTKRVIIKMGCRGSVLVTSSCVCYAPAFKVDVVDTVGCGDSFTAAIAFGFLYDLPMIETLVLANAVGGATAMGCGAGRNVATMDKVIDLLTAADVNDYPPFRDVLHNKDLDMQEVVVASKNILNGVKSPITYISIENVASKLLQMLESQERSLYAQ